MSLRPLLCCLLAGVLCACASVDEPRQSLTAGAPCCAAQDPATVPVLTGETLTLEVTEADPVITFSTGNSHARFVDLGQGRARPSVVVAWPRPRMFNVFSGGRSWGPYFFPAITFLDDRWQVLGEAYRETPGALVDVAEECKPKPRSCRTHGLAVFVPERARYMAVHTPADGVGVTRVMNVGGGGAQRLMPVNGTFVAVTLPSEHRVIGMATGEVKIDAIP